ncbi:iron ABC transporter permease [Nocardioides sp. Root190]|uniref:FecCD family ABC transporter permease n=1 Tax=Nocardioides sp. Root190 TaxID=1736488 RepID=UPI0006F37CC8|nr:iron chelate uptake ABC transporter family permease subunit [Nocardioides sp. Root190]KRB73280.1 iron ABC transporter permease [Nocardioides sp. Root190]
MSARPTSPAPPTAVAVRQVRRRQRRRAVVVPLVLLALVVVLSVLTLCFGSVRLSVDQVLASLLGTRENGAVDFIVQEVSFPQVKAAIAVGLALGAAGTIFQQLLRNPLASPDFVGISSGASVAAVSALAIPAFSGASLPVMALIGAAVTAVLMYLLAWRDGVSGYRFILIGIGVSAFATGVIGYLLTRTSLNEARQALHWLTGSIGQAGEHETDLLLITLLAISPLVPTLQRALRNVELGDDTARVLGNRVELTRLGLLAVGVVLTAGATAVAGPIAFVALVAGPVADRLLGTARGGILAAAAMGAVLCLVSDYIAAEVLPVAMPTGVVTGAVGAPYLLWLIATTNRRGMGG